MKHTRLSNVDNAQIISVIKIESLCGEGTLESPMETITEYFSLEGTRLARVTLKDDPKEIHKWTQGLNEEKMGLMKRSGLKITPSK